MKYGALVPRSSAHATTRAQFPGPVQTPRMHNKPALHIDFALRAERGTIWQAKIEQAATLAITK